MNCGLTEAAYHDTFIIGLGDWNKDFMMTQLDEFFSTGLDAPQNLDLQRLMDKLSWRSREAMEQPQLSD